MIPSRRLRAPWKPGRGIEEEDSRDDDILRAELFTSDQMEQHGAALAAQHVLGSSAGADHLLRRLDENERAVLRACLWLASSVKDGVRIAPAEEWLLDNLALVEEQIRTAKHHLPARYSRELPKLATGPARGKPRVYALAMEAISHGHGRVDTETLGRFLAAYQAHAPLTLGELWAVPIMLRLALVENLRRVATRITLARQHLTLAQTWAQRMMFTAERDPKSLILVTADMARSGPPMVGAFVAELARCLRGHGPSLSLPLTWIEQRLVESSQTIDQLVLAENQRQAEDQVSISNTIGSLHGLDSTDWRAFVEAMSAVEQVLRGDPARAYAGMDFSTRDSYRHAIDRLAKASGRAEVEIATAAIGLASDAAVHSGVQHVTAHVGFFLVDDGLGRLEVTVGAHVSSPRRLQRWLRPASLPMYLGSIILLTGVFDAALVALAREGATPDWLLWVLGLAWLPGASQLACSLTNWISTLLIAPRLLPKMDYTSGLDRAMRTVVAVPALLISAGQVKRLIEDLEVRFLGNQDPSLFFVLLGDFVDAAQVKLPGDEALLEQAASGIEELNARYGVDDGGRFLLLHRPRIWNPGEGVWMGRERKRGKLADLNQLLLYDHRQHFSRIVGNVAAIVSARFVITLDSDTLLPRDSARQCVGAMAHPLNRPRVPGAHLSRPGGYGLLQPRISAGLVGATRSRYARLCGSEPGIDPYTRSVSDVYQDLFGEGSFIGKGIYDVEAFEHALAQRFPDNRILSHDLLEGCYARCGFLSDVHFIEDYPASYTAELRRQHRWIRGDWQIAGWLIPWVAGPDGASLKNPLSSLSRWKILDNLRRSLVPPSVVLLLLFVWSGASSQAQLTLAIIGSLFVPTTLIALVGALRKPADIALRQQMSSSLASLADALLLASFRIACLPVEAATNLDAILRTAWRMLVSHQLLLEWSVQDGAPAGADRSRRPSRLTRSYRQMWMGPALLPAGFFAAVAGRHSPLVAAPLLLLFSLAPVAAWWLSLSPDRKAKPLSPEQQLFLQKLARKTWRFFEQFVCADDNWLPPDNFQEHPGPVVAHRTSPTNIGLTLLANLSALDFGYITCGAFLDRTENSFRTLAKLERHRGHFYNWYDTRSCLPLPPRYVSSVDSGNLAGHLLTLRSGLLSLERATLFDVAVFSGLSATLSHLPESAAGELRTLLAAYSQVAAPCPREHHSRLQVLLRSAEVLKTLGADTTDAEIASWSEAFLGQLRQAADECVFLCPWLAIDDVVADPPWLSATLPTPSLDTLEGLPLRTSAAIDDHHGRAMPAAREHLTRLKSAIDLGAERATQRIRAARQLAAQCADFASVDYAFLYDRDRRLLAIGYNVDTFRRDHGFYDLLASEARLCTFVAIAQEAIPQDSWFALGRRRTAAGGAPVLLSWSGSMFEYLMPMLVMPSYERTLLGETCRAAVRRQIAYGLQLSLPWGVSESGYNLVDVNLNYQYRAFGVPGLGLKQGLGHDLVVAPYASALALMIEPDAATTNLQCLAGMGLEGRYGLYEAADFTPSRLDRGERFSVIRSFMAHHQGMTLLSLAHALLERPMQRRFEDEPAFKSTLLLLQERVPKAAVRGQSAHIAEARATVAPLDAPARVAFTADTPTPQVHLLSNGRYHVMVTAAGGGYSRWKELAVTRWREDSTCDNWGMFVFLRNRDSGEVWSPCHQPTLGPADHTKAFFSEGLAEYVRREGDFETRLEIVVSPEDDIEIRRLRITNLSGARKTVEVTTYAEVVLAAQASDLMQPSFSNLFVQTEFLDSRRALLCTRRPRSVTDKVPWMFHLLAGRAGDLQKLSHETDRARFLGRGGSIAAPEAMKRSGPLSGCSGSVLDPIVSLRCEFSLGPGQSTDLDLVSGAADSREECMILVDRYQDRHLADRVFGLAATHARVTLRQINAVEQDAWVYRHLAGAVLYAAAALRADPGVLLQNRRGQSGLWGYAISGDLPIVLLKIASTENIELARQMIQCHAYWRLRGLAVDLVIWNEDHVGYRQRLQDQIMGLIDHGTAANTIDRPGGIFVRSADQISSEDRILLQAVARAIVTDTRGTLEQQVSRRSVLDKSIGRLPSVRAHSAEVRSHTRIQSPLKLANEFGGFNIEEDEYVITSLPGILTPLPWVNVIANPGFGTVVSEGGAAYSWSENAHEFRITPWSGDAVGGSTGEALYIRDEESGQFWSAAPLPCPAPVPYVTRHGFGYTVFEHEFAGLRASLSTFVDLEEPVKFLVLKVKNLSGRPRRLSATGYVEWVLGDFRQKTAMQVVTEIDTATGALFARNFYNTDFSGQVAFLDVDDSARSLTGDRAEFIGRNGHLKAPAALGRTHLSGRVGPAMDPCGAIQVPFDLRDGQEREIIVRLGTGAGPEDARGRVLRFRVSGCARATLESVRRYWRKTLSAITIQTPDISVNALANGWLVYQTLACRLWARSGYYQSGGAFGFRDQLQDVMALVHAEPLLAREHLLRCAGRQYPEGDVQHWWHPPSGKGVRTRCSDDFLWLAMATCRYVTVTGDRAVLDEEVAFIEGRLLNGDEESCYDRPTQSAATGSLYEHGKRAVLRGLRLGTHGLPLMGSGDWNDGMNLVGIQGRGESVWLAFFLYQVLVDYRELARARGDAPFAEHCGMEAERLRLSIARDAWDGEWYRRAFFDDGTPLGSASNLECSIDSVAQSWSVLSGAGEISHQRTAMASLDRRLVHPEHGVIQLLDPPFDRSSLNPGYIKGYVPGVRENGGQYTHAAIWASMAFAALGDSAAAWKLLALINPLNHADGVGGVHVYKGEPYVVAADVYAVAPHWGRAGWTWYTGSAGWLYRLILESLLGLRREGNTLSLEPCVPAHWPHYTITYRFHTASYRIRVTQVLAAKATPLPPFTLDGQTQPSRTVLLVDDGQTHTVDVIAHRLTDA